MNDSDLLLEMTTLATSIGRDVASAPPPPPFRTMAELRRVFDAIDEPLGQRMVERLHLLRPEAAVGDELDGEQLPEHGEVWVVDAIDGAIQYLHGHPEWCVSVALVRDRAPVAAVLHSPSLGATYAAAAGRGATRNGQPIAPATKTDLGVALAGTSQPPFVARFPEVVRLAGASLSAMLGGVGAVRNLGATAWQVADVGSGRLDAFWQYGVDDVNLLGATLIAREAGAAVTDATGCAWRAGASSVLVAAPSLQPELLALLRYCSSST